MELPLAFQRKIRTVFGARGEAWLIDLPKLRAQAEARWGVRIGEPYALSYNYVARATRADGSDAVWKCGVPRRDGRIEIEAVRAFAGRGAVVLIAADDAACSFLLQRVTPGTRLSDIDLDDAAKTRIAAGVMMALQCPAPPDVASNSSAASGALHTRTVSHPASSAANARSLIPPANLAPSMLRSSLKTTPSKPSCLRKTSFSQKLEKPAGRASTAV